MRHKYAVGQMVDLIPSPRLSNRPSGLCEVLVQLPFEGSRLQYRVQSLAENNQRVVNEEDLRPSTASTGRAEEATPPFARIPVLRR
ncbi:hypothetical protein VE25_14120 [Devosia geojensis]|uniref:Cold-shock protein n=1 Tax=Devosia geojensis TaxID=443610 RepID=A0A0F5FSL3_9HYPH|nr:hypothetical protein [Devosia geojensis]KKB11152.1 hypothetical protein VE25_14120 [Devosia geojensis]